MQIKLKIGLVLGAFGLASLPAFAVDMPADGTKNFSAPSDAPSYFSHETVPELARVASPATFSSEEVAAVPEIAPAYPSGTETRRHGKHASAHRSAKHTFGTAKGAGRSTRYPTGTSSKTTRTAALHTSATRVNAGSRSAGTAKSAGKSATQAGASKTNTTKHARIGTRQHAAAAPPPPRALPVAIG